MNAYAKNQNKSTAVDLKTCLEALLNKGLMGLSPSELKHAKILKLLALKYADAYDTAYELYEIELDDERGYTQDIDDAKAMDVKHKYRDEF